jgi:hypothetical protein
MHPRSFDNGARSRRAARRRISPSLAAGVALVLLTRSPAVAGDDSRDWWSLAQQDLRESEYRITWQDETELADVPAAWHAPNREQGFRVYFTERGIRVVPRLPDSPAWE